MSKPDVHAENSVRKQKAGRLEDYLPIHQMMDSSKSAMGDNRHRALTHNAWFIGPDGPLERSFGTFDVRLLDSIDEYVGTAGPEQHVSCPGCKATRLWPLGTSELRTPVQGSVRVGPTTRRYTHGRPR